MQSDHEFAPTQIAAAEFPTAFRGYDQDAVRHYLTRLASALSEKGGDALAALARTTTLDRIEELEEENDTLRSEVRDLELELVQRSVDGPAEARSAEHAGRRTGDGDDEFEADLDTTFDEHRAIELLGQETARVLESARSAAADIVKRAERHAKEIEKDARTDLADARRKARRLVAEKQAEAEELVAKVAAEAEESATTMRTEAEQHREMVLAESKKIMADAEERAAADEKWAQDRAEQIVADAESLRQQLLSELVVERTRIRTDLEEMLSTRDRLVMALVVARSEMDDLSTRLDEASVKSPTTTPDIDVDAADTTAQVEELVAQLDEQLDPDTTPLKSAPARSTKSSAADAAPPADSESGDDADDPSADEETAGPADEVIDLTDGGDDKPAGGGSSRTSKRSNSRARSRNKKSSRRRNSGTSTAGDASPKSPSATAVVEADGADVDDPELDVDAEPTQATDGVEGDTDGDQERESDDQPDLDAEAEGGSDGNERDATTPEADDDESIELSLIEGFNTIELSEAELVSARRAAATAADGTDADEGGDPSAQVLVTVASRETGTDMEGNRGDLLIDEEYRGRLPSEVAARDTALARADDFHRSLRRALNDDQSEVLDRLRVGRGAVEVIELPKFSDQIERYLQPLRDGLAPVALAGAKTGGRREVPTGVLDNLVKQLAKYIVDKVRIPVIREVEHSTDHDREKLFEPIRSVYRDFRNAGLLELADDALYESFAIGLYGAIPAGSNVIWLLDPRHDPDPVCEINAGRSGLVKGDKFPSGHVRPLALPNCRCLVVAD